MNRTYTKYAGCVYTPKGSIIFIDLETTGLNPLTDRIVKISFCENSYLGFVYDDIEVLKPILLNPNIMKVFHNAVFDIGFICQALKIKQLPGMVYDTQILAQLYNSEEESLSLKDLSVKYLGAESIKCAEGLWSWLKTNKLTKADISKAPEEILNIYAIEDVLNTAALFDVFKTKIKAMDKQCQEWEFTANSGEYYRSEMMPMIHVLVDMYRRGIKMDLEQVSIAKLKLQQRSNELAAELSKVGGLDVVEKHLHDALCAKKLKVSKTGKLKTIPPKIPFKWKSNQHLTHLLNLVYKIDTGLRTNKGAMAVTEAVLSKLSNKLPWVTTLLEYREVNKLLSTYLDSLLNIQVGGYIHANYNLTGTATGRLSSSHPNMQNLPSHGGIRKLFVPESGYKFIYADYSQIEYRIVTHLSEDPILLNAYQSGSDMHTATAEFLGIERKLAKTVNFAAIYGAGGYRLQQILNLSSADEGAEILNKLLDKYVKLREYIQTQKTKFIQYGIAVTPFGRVRRLEGIRSPDRKLFSHALKAGFNMVPQSMGASICKRALCALYDEGFHIVNQVHDSIIAQVWIPELEEKQAQIKSIMENIVKLKVPLIAEVKLLNSLDEKDVYNIPEKE